MTIEDDEDDGPRFQGGGSSDDDNMASANIKHTTFESKSASGSFGASPSRDLPPNGNLKFMSTVQNAYYRPQQQLQMRPERARPVEDLSVDGLGDTRMRQNINRIRMILPQIYSVLMIKNALIQTKGSMDEAVALLLGEAKPRFSPTPPQQQQRFSPQPLQQLPPRNTSQKLAPIDLTADEPKMVQVPVPEMKRMLAQPAKSIRDKYSSTQTLAPRPIISTPPQPKRRLVKGRRQPSSPAGPAVDSPVRPCSPAMDEYDSDSGVASASEEDPELEGRVLSYLNKCSVTDLIELTNIKKDVAEIMVNARPFKSINAARCVENSKPLKSGKKSARAPIGDRIVDTAMEMFQGYEAIDTLVARCRDIGKPLADEMAKWGFDVFGQKNGELEMTSFEDNDSQRDSGIGSPTSGSASNNGEDDVKAAPRRRANVQFLKKPEMMAESCTLKDYQIVGLNWLALMYRKQLSGILADEMGLGKTCQVISFLTHLIETGHHGPHLVVCPASTLENWLREFQKFSPQLQVEPYHGSQKERVEMSETILANRDQVNVVVTTYEMAANKNDNKFMRKLRADVSHSIRLLSATLTARSAVYMMRDTCSRMSSPSDIKA
jgi:SWI/SNF-related matrix-associated actin-dependent regulator 1 of chromatin subfamily A